jgi:GNAT superfamily N-acetyltransferase
MPTFTLRHADPSDYAPIIAVVDRWWGGRHMADMLPKLFFVHFRPTSFVAEARGRVVGFLAGFRSQTFPEQAYIHFVGVDPAFRLAGVARALYERFFSAARAAGCTEAHGVTSPANKGSLHFHAAMGFDFLPGDAEEDGVPYTADYDGRGEPRVRLRKLL